MGKVVMAREVGKQVCEALGLDASKVQDISIRLFPADVAHVYVTMTPNQDEFGNITRILKHYTLHDENPDAQPEAAED